MERVVTTMHLNDITFITNAIGVYFNTLLLA